MSSPTEPPLPSSSSSRLKWISPGGLMKHDYFDNLLYNMFTECRGKRLTDCCFLLRGGKQRHAHSDIICRVSPLLNLLWLNNTLFKDGTETMTVSLPDTTTLIMDSLLQLLYTGRLLISGKENIELRSLCQTLSIDLNIDCQVEMIDEDVVQMDKGVISRKMNSTPYCRKVLVDNPKSNDMSSEETSGIRKKKRYCLCRSAECRHMLGCDLCDEWFHSGCLGLSKEELDRLKNDVWRCAQCAVPIPEKTVQDPKLVVVSLPNIMQTGVKGWQPSKFSDMTWRKKRKRSTQARTTLIPPPPRPEGTLMITNPLKPPIISATKPFCIMLKKYKNKTHIGKGRPNQSVIPIPKPFHIRLKKCETEPKIRNDQPKQSAITFSKPKFQNMLESCKNETKIGNDRLLNRSVIHTSKPFHNMLEKSTKETENSEIFDVDDASPAEVAALNNEENGNTFMGSSSCEELVVKLTTTDELEGNKRKQRPILFCCLCRSIFLSRDALVTHMQQNHVVV